MAQSVDDSDGLAMQDASSSSSTSNGGEQQLTAADVAAADDSRAPTSAQSDAESNGAVQPTAAASDLLDSGAPSVAPTALISETAEAAGMDSEMAATEEQKTAAEAVTAEHKEASAAAEERADTAADDTSAEGDAAAAAEEKESGAVSDGAGAAADADGAEREGEGGGDVVVEEVLEMDDEQVQELFKHSIISLLTDPQAGELSLATVKQHLREQHGKQAVKQHKDVSINRPGAQSAAATPPYLFCADDCVLLCPAVCSSFATSCGRRCCGCRRNRRRK